MDLVAGYKYGKSKLYRRFECPACRTDLHHSGCCCEVRPVMIPINQCEKGVDIIMALPRTLLAPRDARAASVDKSTTESKKFDTDDKQDETDEEYDLTDNEQDTPDERQAMNDGQDNMSDEGDNSDGRLYARNRQSVDNHSSDKSRTLPRYSQKNPDGSVRTFTDRPVVYDINNIPQPSSFPLGRLRAQNPRLNDPRGWDCRVVGGRLEDVVDPVCGQCVYDLTRYRWLKYKYDELEPAWKGYNSHHSTLPEKRPNGDVLPGAGLRKFPGLSWKLAVINAYLCLDSRGLEKKPTWGRWPRELDYMLKQRGWTKGVEFVDWKKAEPIPSTPKPSAETQRDFGVMNRFLSGIRSFLIIANTEETHETEDPETLALSVDWKPSQRALDNGLRLCDMEGMGPYHDWDELLEEPVWRALGISKVARDRWAQAFGREVQAHVLGKYLEGHGRIIMQTDNFSFYTRRRLDSLIKGEATSNSRWPLWLTRTIQFISIYVRSTMGFGLVVMFLLYIFGSVMVGDFKRSWDLRWLDGAISAN
ncbi:hypothetical protein QBC45DRAFT_409382 [Copromyces sp. CBS 386.78]|nr:hypothetical protein QBC45DRAFT_409382 [Copromyces sp. CBS 386.78]